MFCFVSFSPLVKQIHPLGYWKRKPVKQPFAKRISQQPSEVGQPVYPRFPTGEEQGGASTSNPSALQVVGDDACQWI